MRAARPRLCDLGYLRSPYRKDDGRVGYRCPAEPVEMFVRKGGSADDAAGRACLCNALSADVGLGQTRPDGRTEEALVTLGADLAGAAGWPSCTPTAGPPTRCSTGSCPGLPRGRDQPPVRVWSRAPPALRRAPPHVAPRRATRSGVRLPAIAGGRTELGWFLTAEQRGNDATRIRPWTEGNAVRPLVHGSTYFAVLAEALAQAGQGDLVLFSDWRGDPDERLTDGGATVTEALSAAVLRGALVKGLMWRSHLDRLRFSNEENRSLAESVNDVGGEVLLDQRVRAVGSHHQKFVVIRHPERPGGRRRPARRDRPGARPAGRRRPPRRSPGPAVRPPVRAAPGVARRPRRDPRPGRPRRRGRVPGAVGGSRRPVAGCRGRRCPDLLHREDRQPGRLPPPAPDPPAAGTCAVQLLRTYPQRRPGYPFAPDGERSAARGYAKALRRARRLVYIEDQYLWSADVAQVFAAALRREPGLHLVAVVPRYPDQDDRLGLPPVRLGHARALQIVRAAGGDRVQVLDVENHDGVPVYVHAKVCVIDDVWATVGSDNFNRRSWTHDSELTAAILDRRLDGREPRDPAGLGDGARAFARELRLELLARAPRPRRRRRADRSRRRDRGPPVERRRPRRVARRRALGPASAWSAADAPGRAAAALAAPARDAGVPRDRGPRRAAAVDEGARAALTVTLRQGTFAPPLTLMTSPTTKLDSGEARNT